jgi:hypothetical protein
VEIPEPVREIYALYRPTPLYRAEAAGAGAGTPGPHLLQVRGRQPGRQPQAEHRGGPGLLQQAKGVRRLTTETGAGQWGSALAMACRFFGLECKVYMVKVSYEQKPYRRVLMETWGAQVVPSPSPDTQAGRAVLAREPGLARQPRHRHQRGGGGRGQQGRHEVLPGQRAKPRAPAPDGDRPGGQEAAGAGRRVPGRGSRVCRRRLQLRRPGVPLCRGQAPGSETCASWPWSPRPARA